MFSAAAFHALEALVESLEPDEIAVEVLRERGGLGRVKTEDGWKAVASCEITSVDFVVRFVRVMAGPVADAGGSPETGPEELSAAEVCPVSFFICLAVLALCAR
jgi:hypothetical protein